MIISQMHYLLVHKKKAQSLKKIFFNYKTTNKPSKKKKNSLFSAPFNNLQDYPPPHNQLTFYTRCLLQSTTQGFFLNSSSKTDFKKKEEGKSLQIQVELSSKEALPWQPK